MAEKIAEKEVQRLRTKVITKSVKLLLQKELRHISTLKTLVVQEKKFVTDGSSGNYEIVDADFATPAIEWFERRAKREYLAAKAMFNIPTESLDEKQVGHNEVGGDKDSIEEESTENTELAGDKECCAFCREEHVWPDCHNLCAFCGGYGHWKLACPTHHSLYDLRDSP